MTRPLRIEFPGALYHVTSRGDRRNAIYRDDTDRYIWLEVLGRVCARFNFTVHAYCQMTNHYHVMVETTDGNLAEGMRQLNAIFSQRVNQRHKLVGHVFQGRYKAVLVQKDSYLLELARYIVLNPVRAGFVCSPGKWFWSSYHAMLDARHAPSWLQTRWLLDQFSVELGEPVEAYRQFVTAGIGLPNPLHGTRYQLILGDDNFTSRHRSRQQPDPMPAVTRTQRKITAMTLPEYAAQFAERDEAMARAYWSTAFTMTEIGAHFGVSYKTVSRAVSRYESRLPGPAR